MVEPPTHHSRMADQVTIAEYLEYVARLVREGRVVGLSLHFSAGEARATLILRDQAEPE